MLKITVNIFRKQHRNLHRNITANSKYFCSRADDEFIIPTSFTSDGEMSFLWSVGEYNNLLDLGSESFVGPKELVVSFPNIKIMKVTHKDKGVITFVIMLCDDKKWRIASTVLFGEQSALDLNEHGPIECIVQYTSHLNLQDKDSIEENCLVAPYQFIESPSALKMDEYYIHEWESLSQKGYSYSWFTYPTILLSSQHSCWLQSDMTTFSSGGKRLAITNKLFLMVNDPFLGWRVSAIILANTKNIVDDSPVTR